MQGLAVAIVLENTYSEGAKLIVTDIDREKVSRAKEWNVETVHPDDIYQVEVIYSPNAGSILNDETIPKLKCEIIVGGPLMFYSMMKFM